MNNTYENKQIHEKESSQKEKLPKRNPYEEAERLKKAGHSIIGICVCRSTNRVYIARY